MKFMLTDCAKKEGFALPTVLIASVVMLIVLLSAIGASASVRSAIDSQYYNQLGREAVESGLALATECLKLNTAPNWTDAAPLRPTSGCVGSVPEDGFVIDTAQVKTSFTVGAYTTDSSGHTSITAKGQVSLRRLSAPTETWRSYEQTSRRTVEIIPLFATLSGNDSHTCALASSQVFCWGDNTYGQLGNGTTSSSLYPKGIKYVNGLVAGTITDIGTGNAHTCALSQQKVWCWGTGSYGQLGTGGTPASSPLPTLVGGLLAGKTVTSLTVGAYHTCVVATGKAYCWGWNPDGQLGDGTTANKLIPTAVNTTSAGNPLNGKTITKISTQDYHSCVIISGGTVACWGRNANGQLGNNTTTNSAVAVTSVAGSVTDIGTGAHHTCVIAVSRVYCWGLNGQGQLGYGDQVDRSQHAGPVGGVVMGTDPVTALAVGDYHTCAVALGKAYCWGRNYDGPGQLGDNTQGSKLSPVAVYTGNFLSGKTIVDVSASDFGSCAITDKKAAYCWGKNTYGQVGDNTTLNRWQAVKVYTANFKPAYTDF
jgi:alpha-tubulin suppressor-like RCC1 family protein